MSRSDQRDFIQFMAKRESSIIKRICLSFDIVVITIVIMIVSLRDYAVRAIKPQLSC